MANPIERYQKLSYKEALKRTHLYPIACKELSLILRGAYHQLPKNLQSIIFQDTLFAFHLLPEMLTTSADSAANRLFQSAEVVFPKQKKNLAASEFKKAKVAHKRHIKSHHEEEGTFDLPEDILVHIFSYLDVQSLVSSSIVCWSWNSAASNNNLWQSQYAKVFRGSLKTKKKKRGMTSIDQELSILQESESATMNIDWRHAFKRAYSGSFSKRLTSYRGFCGQCKAVVWLDNMSCTNGNCQFQSQSQNIVPISSLELVEYLLNGSSSILHSSDSDSESDEELAPKLWAYPKHIFDPLLNEILV